MQLHTSTLAMRREAVAMPARMRVRARRNRVPAALHAREGAARAKVPAHGLRARGDSCKCEACVCMCV
jgi:hypothetical protein